MQIRARNQLSNKNKRFLQISLIDFFGEQINNFLQKDMQIEEVRTDEGTFLAKDRRIWFFDYEEKKIPSIHFLRESKISLPKVVVDIGAIKFVTNGADVMAPGVVFFDEEIKENSLVSIHEEKANTILGIGFSLVDSKEFKKSKKGKIVKTIHHLTDKIWKFQL